MRRLREPVTAGERRSARHVLLGPVGVGVAVSTVLVLALAASAPVHAAASDPSVKRDKGCAKGVRDVLHRQGTFRAVIVFRRVAACDTRYGRIVELFLQGTERSDGDVAKVTQSGPRAVVLAERRRPGASQAFKATYNYVNLRSGIRRRLADVRDATFKMREHRFRADGTLLYRLAGRVSTRLGTVASTRLGIVGTDGRVDVLPGLPRSATVTSVDLNAFARRARTCQPGKRGNGDATFLREGGDLLIWTLNGVARACPEAPTGELRLPCAGDLLAPERAVGAVIDTAFSAGRLAYVCSGPSDVMHLIDVVARTTVAQVPLGGSGLDASVAVSPEGITAVTGRADGQTATEANALSVINPDGTGLRVVGTAGFRIGGVRFTGPRALAWTAFERPDGPGLARSAQL